MRRSRRRGSTQISWPLLAAVLPGCGSIAATDDDATDGIEGDDAGSEGAEARDDDAGSDAVDGDAPDAGHDAGDGTDVAAEDSDSDGADADRCLDGGVSCDDGNPCTDDRCDPALGCVRDPNSAPCDDLDPCTAGDACRDGACRPATVLASWYRDEDGDSYGNGAAEVCDAEPPSGYVADRTDCCDTDPDVHPAQESWFDVARRCGDESFDYDCSGLEELRWTGTGGGCSLSGGLCRSTVGWQGSTPPACGAAGHWISECNLLTCLVGASETRVQECR